jgi:hypothetical protein
LVINKQQQGWQAQVGATSLVRNQEPEVIEVVLQQQGRQGQQQQQQQQHKTAVAAAAS